MIEKTNAKEAYHKKIIESKNDMNIRKYRFRLENEHIEDYQKILELKNKRIQRGKWIAQANNRERKILGFKELDREGLK